MEVELFHRTTVHHPIGLWVKGCGVDVEDPQDGGQLGSQCSYFRETKENGEDQEDLAGHNIFLTVALGSVWQISLTGSVGGWGYFVDFVAKMIKNFVWK